MPRLAMTDAQVSGLIQELRGLDLSSKPALQDLLKRLERVHGLTDRNDAAARYPTPPAEGSQEDLGEKNADSQTQGSRARKASESASWRCQPQDPSSHDQSHELRVPMQSVFALDTASAAARATIKHFESRHSRARARDVDAGQGEHRLTHDIKTEEDSNADVIIVETVGLRKSKRRRTRVE